MLKSIPECLFIISLEMVYMIFAGKVIFLLEPLSFMNIFFNYYNEITEYEWKSCLHWNVRFLDSYLGFFVSNVKVDYAIFYHGSDIKSQKIFFFCTKLIKYSWSEVLLEFFSITLQWKYFYKKGTLPNFMLCCTNHWSLCTARKCWVKSWSKKL